jgi:ABC-type Zn uptake system ZnuABC Zn-binding protein ZnuA
MAICIGHSHVEWSVRQQIALIPQQNRKLVAFHDAFRTSRASTASRSSAWRRRPPGQDPSAADIAALIQAIKAAGVKAIFSENQFPTKLVDQLAQETGPTVVSDL